MVLGTQVGVGETHVTVVGVDDERHVGLLLVGRRREPCPRLGRQGADWPPGGPGGRRAAGNSRGGRGGKPPKGGGRGDTQARGGGRATGHPARGGGGGKPPKGGRGGNPGAATRGRQTQARRGTTRNAGRGGAALRAASTSVLPLLPLFLLLVSAVVYSCCSSPSSPLPYTRPRVLLLLLSLTALL